MLFGGELEIEIDRGDEIAARYGWNRIDLILNAATAVDYNFTITIFAAQVIVLSLLDATLADDVAGF